MPFKYDFVLKNRTYVKPPSIADLPGLSGILSKSITSSMIKMANIVV